jgi:ubiquinol-cytochrome c reductase cytochrome c subunit
VKRLVATFGLLLVAASCSYVDREPTPYRPPTTQAADARDGEALYMGDCSWCHGNEAQGSERAPGLLEETNGPALTHFMLSTGRMPIDDPGERSLGGDPLYDDDQILAIIEFLDTFFPEGPEIPELDLEGADLSEGLELYQNDCASCHATTGIGGALTTSERGSDGPIDPGIIAPDLFSSTPLQIAEAVRTGPGTMPVFSEGTFDDEQLASLVAYVDELDEAPDLGGAPLGRVGPVIEGAVGWAVGVTLLLAFARWIGTRAGEE